MTTEDERWLSWAAAFELLSKAFLLPSRETAKALAGGEFSDACRELADLAGLRTAPGEDPAADLASYAGRDADSVLSEIRCEYTRLFVGTRDPLVTPYLGVWAAQRRGQRGLLFLGEESRAVEAFMHRCGVAKNLGAGQSNEPLDHLGTMCEFLMLLCLIEARAVLPPEGGTVEDGDCALFFSERFRDFAADVSAQVRAVCTTPFYRAMAWMLGALVEALPLGGSGEAGSEPAG